MEPLSEVPPFEASLIDDQTVMLRRLRPDIAGRAGIEILDPRTNTRINIRHGDAPSPMLEDMLRPAFVAWTLLALAERDRSRGE